MPKRNEITEKDLKYNLRPHRGLIVLCTAILNTQHTYSQKELERIATDVLNQSGMDWDKKKNGVILK